MRGIVIAAVLAASIAEASALETGKELIQGHSSTFEQILSEGSGGGGKYFGSSLNELDRIFLGSAGIREVTRPDELQSLIVQANTTALGMHAENAQSDHYLSVAPGRQAVINSPAKTDALTVTTGWSASKADLAVTLERASGPRAEAVNSPGDREKGDLASSGMSIERASAAAMIVLLLWVFMTAAVMLVHSQQKEDELERTAMLRAVLRKKSSVNDEASQPKVGEPKMRYGRPPEFASGLATHAFNSNAARGLSDAA